MLRNLKKLREDRKMTQKQLADVISVSQQSINKYENHNIEPDIATLIRMAEYFNTSVDYLIGYSEVRRKIEIVRSYDLSTEEAELIDDYRRLTPKQRQSLQLIIENYREC